MIKVSRFSTPIFSGFIKKINFLIKAYQENIYPDFKKEISFGNDNYILKDMDNIENVSTYLERPLMVEYNVADDKFYPLWPFVNESIQTIMVWWYNNYNLPATAKVPASDLIILKSWLYPQPIANKALSLKALLKGQCRYLSLSQLLNAGFYPWEMTIESCISFNCRWKGSPDSITLIRRSRISSCEINIRPFTGEVLTVRTGLRLTNSGLYYPEERWNKKRFTLVSFANKLPVITKIDQYHHLNKITDVATEE